MLVLDTRALILLLMKLYIHIVDILGSSNTIPRNQPNIGYCIVRSVILQYSTRIILYHMLENLKILLVKLVKFTQSI